MAVFPETLKGADEGGEGGAAAVMVCVSVIFRSNKSKRFANLYQVFGKSDYLIPVLRRSVAQQHDLRRIHIHIFCP